MNRLIFHPDLCVGCFACEVACKAEYHLPVGVKWIQVNRDEETGGDGKQRLSFQVNVCRQCEHPPCVSACSVGAIFQRKDGLIILEEEKCNGCRECIKDCPWKVIAFDSARQRASKCNLCTQLAELRCLKYCPTSALTTASSLDFENDLPPS
jgi:Fe-S-cluster-containing dehydrogenase component